MYLELTQESNKQKIIINAEKVVWFKKNNNDGTMINIDGDDSYLHVSESFESIGNLLYSLCLNMKP